MRPPRVTVYRSVDAACRDLSPKSRSRRRSGALPGGAWRVLPAGAGPRPCPAAPTYQRRQPERSVLNRAIQAHLASEACYIRGLLEARGKLSK